MNVFIKKNKVDISDAFLYAADGVSLPPVVVEKDFWVCWLLNILFNEMKLDSELLFKGGTSLSKGYGIIQRFSEDIDLSLYRPDLGFELEIPPGTSGSKIGKIYKALAVGHLEYVQDVLLPSVYRELSSRLDVDGWSLEIDENDGGSLLFSYPRVLDGGFYQIDSYVKPVVKVETGIRAAYSPAGGRTITSFVGEVVPEALGEVCSFEVHTLAAERTFWEKATILHAINSRNDPTRVKDRLSRHIYDLVMLNRDDVTGGAKDDLDLLQQVVDHKKVYYREPQAQYEEAKPGSFKLVPTGPVLDVFKKDYISMGDMFPDTPPPFEELLSELQKMEAKINAAN